MLCGVQIIFLEKKQILPRYAQLNDLFKEIFYKILCFLFYYVNKENSGRLLKKREKE